MKIALAQFAMDALPEKNLKKALDMIKKAAASGAKVVCLPEVFTSPYFPQEEKAEAERFAEPVPGPSSDALSKAARENRIIVVGGSVFEKDGKKFYNTSFVIDENGKLLGKYRKIHIPHDPSFYEQNYFEKGDLGYKVFNTSAGKIAVMICYDQWFPEAARSVALLGADMVFYPTAIGLVEGVEQAEGNWQDAWTSVQVGHAIANCMVVAGVNRVGREGKMKFWGGSFVSSQFGTILAKGSDNEELVVAEVDISLGKKVREGWRFFYNRRPETYGKLVEK
ncbi:MAG TPA: carbon-nitrogen hydrolase [Candidatus Bilamarchaeum sp.]|nr:carbon-nitrogen hydrolase [Candidatus Bilamarchaeum sp.]